MNSQNQSNLSQNQQTGINRTGFNQGLNSYNGQNIQGQNQTLERVILPTQVRELPVAVHEEIRQELVEEVQPIIEVEKFKTEVHQVTQPLFDKEIRSVNVQSKTLATEILPEVNVQGRGVAMPQEHSTVRNLGTSSVVVEKPAKFIEIEKKQIIEEIQPIVYKETIVPTVIQETKPVYQKIVEGPVYVSETLAARSLSGSGYNYPANYSGNQQQFNSQGLNQGQWNQQQSVGLNQQSGLNQQGLGLNNQTGINQTGLNQQGLNQGQWNQEQRGLNQTGLNQQQQQGLNQQSGQISGNAAIDKDLYKINKDLNKLERDLQNQQQNQQQTYNSL
jgi:hypothetical protein